MPTEYTSLPSRDGTRYLTDDGERCIQCHVLWPRGTKHDCPQCVVCGNTRRYCRHPKEVFDGAEPPVGPMRMRSANCIAAFHEECLGMVEQDTPGLGITDCLCHCHWTGAAGDVGDDLLQAAKDVVRCGVGNLSGYRYKQRVAAFDALTDVIEAIEAQVGGHVS